MYLPLEIIQLITNCSDVITKFRILSTSKEINDNVYINTFYDKLYIKHNIYGSLKIYEYPKISHKITGKILYRHRNITELNLRKNGNIHDSDIKHLKYLRIQKCAFPKA